MKKNLEEIKPGIYKDDENYIFCITKVYYVESGKLKNEKTKVCRGYTIFPKERRIKEKGFNKWDIREDSILEEWKDYNTYFIGGIEDYPEYFI